VGHEKDGRAAAPQPLDHGLDGAAGDVVERRRRLVEEKDLRLVLDGAEKA
jgi:hypothetical protein